MYKLLLVAVLVIGIPTLSLASPCVPGSVTGYVGLGAGGCQIGAATFFDFSQAVSFAGGTEINPALVLITPSNAAAGPKLDFLFTGSAASNQILGIAIGYSISGSPLNGASLSLNGAAADGDGVATVIEDICRGGTFLSDPSNCSQPGPATLVTAQDFLGPSGPDSRTFPVNSFFDVFVDITLDGGPAGSASGGMVTTQFNRVPTVPESSTAILLGCGLLAVWAFGRHRGSNSRKRELS